MILNKKLILLFGRWIYRIFVKALGKGSFITSTTTVNNINIVDLEGYIGSMTKEEAFLEIPEGPNKEAELKKRPIIPICFRIAKTEN